MSNLRLHYAAPFQVSDGYTTKGSIGLWDGQALVTVTPLYSWENARLAYKQMDIIRRLMAKGYSLSGAKTIAENSVHPPHELGYTRLHAFNYSTDERVSLYPVPEEECGDTDPDIINDWLSEAYAVEYGLECGDAVSERDLYYFFLINYADDMPVPAYLEHEAKLWDGVEEFAVDEALDGWESPHHLNKIPY